MRAPTASVLLLIAGTLACTDAFGPGDAMGRWELRTINGIDVPAPLTVYDGVNELTAVIERAHFDFVDGGACVWTTVEDGVELSNPDCTWELLDGEEPLRVVIGEFVTRGSVTGFRMALEGEWGNVFVFEKS